jgi:hypothetical protein
MKPKATAHLREPRFGLCGGPIMGSTPQRVSVQTERKEGIVAGAPLDSCGLPISREQRFATAQPPSFVNPAASPYATVQDSDVPAREQEARRRTEESYVSGDQWGLNQRPVGACPSTIDACRAFSLRLPRARRRNDWHVGERPKANPPLTSDAGVLRSTRLRIKCLCLLESGATRDQGLLRDSRKAAKH